jgi:hypothetical protein
LIWHQAGTAFLPAEGKGPRPAANRTTPNPPATTKPDIKSASINFLIDFADNTNDSPLQQMSAYIKHK